MGEKLVVKIEKEVASLVPRFLANRALDVDRIRAALGRSDFDAIRAIGHGLKGVGGGYGFPDISRLGSDIEEAAKRGEYAAIVALVADLDDYLVRLDVQYP